ncbi:MAG: MFS transporter [Actinomycetota bacterium]
MSEDSFDTGGLLGHATDAKADFGALVRNRNFMKLFWGQLISNAGDWLATFALMSLVFTRLTHNSSLAVGSMLAFRIVPALFSGPVAALVSDRFDRRKLMIGCDVMRGLVIIAAPFLTEVWHVYVMLFIFEGLSIIWLAARDASIPNLVPDEHLTMANSLALATTYGVIPFSAVLFSLLMIPANSYTPGGFLAAHPTLFPFALDSVSFFVSAVFFMQMHLLSPKHHGHVEERLKFGESVSFAFRHPLTRSLLLGAAVGCIGGGSIYAVGIGYIKDVMGAKSDAAFGFLMALFGVGMIVGVVALQVLVKREEKPWMLRVAMLVTGGIMIGMSFVRLLWLTYLMALFFGASFGVVIVMAITIVQEHVEDKDRGKAFAAFHAIARIFLVLGAALSGGLAGLIGVRQLHVLGLEIQVWGYSVALFIAGLLICSASVLPLGEKKKDRFREYFART